MISAIKRSATFLKPASSLNLSGDDETEGWYPPGLKKNTGDWSLILRNFFWRFSEYDANFVHKFLVDSNIYSNVSNLHIRHVKRIIYDMYIIYCTLHSAELDNSYSKRLLLLQKLRHLQKTHPPPTFHLPRNASMMAAEVILFCSARVSLLIDAMARRKRGTKIASNNLQRSPPLQRPTPRAQKGAFDTSRGRPSKMAPLSCNFLHQNTLGDGRINNMNMESTNLVH